VKDINFNKLFVTIESNSSALVRDM